MRRAGTHTLSLLIALTALPCPLSNLWAQEATPGDGASSVHDFDFLCGSWSVRNRLLKKRLAHSGEWVEFGAADEFQVLPGGLGTEERFSTDHWPAYVALGLHLYDPRAKRWTLYWADNRNAPGSMQTLATGTFSARDTGTFYAPDTLDGQAVTVRIIWKRIDEDHAHWEQALSPDSGKTWETNWTMEFTRRDSGRCTPAG